LERTGIYDCSFCLSLLFDLCFPFFMRVINLKSYTINYKSVDLSENFENFYFKQNRIRETIFFKRRH
jgi:hypothetical protein